MDLYSVVLRQAWLWLYLLVIPDLGPFIQAPGSQRTETIPIRYAPGEICEIMRKISRGKSESPKNWRKKMRHNAYVCVKPAVNINVPVQSDTK